MNYALVVVDMIKDNVDLTRGAALDIEANKIIPRINELSAVFRSKSEPVIFACDSFMADDFIFGGLMKPHAIRGTGGDLPIKELNCQTSDLILPKRRMSAFYKTDLDQTLRTWNVKTVVVCGIMTNVCVLLTALDAIQNDFSAIIITDASTCYKAELHDMTLKVYEGFPLFPLFRTMSTAEVISEITAN
ncbi:MAG: cysteine hydrolase [Deltaproteobacteria bacterium]|nr:cysteine hydrolase [Deltaproteobacteria bacterium]